MAALLNKDEIVSIAFTRKIDIIKIPDKLIESVQNTHIMPVLGKALYDLVIASPLNYSLLIDYIKPIIAYYVKYYILPEIWLDISTTGINKINGNNRISGNSEEFNQALQSALNMANMMVSSLTLYLNDNETLYPDYTKWSNPDNRIKILGGIIFPIAQTDYDDE